MNVDTAAAMGAAAFRNAIRLHRDAVLLYRNGRLPSAFQLSVLSQEEIGKAFMLEEYVFRVRIGENHPQYLGRLLSDILKHRWKQLWFAKEEVDHGDPPFSDKAIQLVNRARTGKTERRKQDATYVGRLDGHGRVQTPEDRIGSENAAEQISRVSDVLRTLVDGFLGGRLIVDTDELEACLTPELRDELRDLWP